MGVVALAGVLPFFSEITGGALLPVTFTATPFVLALATGALCLAIYVIPSAIGRRGSGTRAGTRHGIRRGRRAAAAHLARTQERAEGRRVCGRRTVKTGLEECPHHRAWPPEQD